MKQKDIEMFKDILTIYEKRSTCARLKVASLLIKEGRIISTGYNGVLSGHQHCEDYFNNDREKIKNEHHLFSEQHEIHAECNTICICAKNGVSTRDAVLFCSVCPCSSCAKLIVASGIKEVYYVDEYDRESFGRQLLENSGISVFKI